MLSTIFSCEEFSGSTQQQITVLWVRIQMSSMQQAP